VNETKKKFLILPGYLIGIGCLALLTYRTFLAFFSESKSITIQVNRYGEQYSDIAVLVFIWIVCLIGLLYLSTLLKEENVKKVIEGDIRGRNVMNTKGLSLDIVRDALRDEKTGTVTGALQESSKETDQGLSHLNEQGNRSVSSDSVEIISDIIEE
jgi:hypothetical protein